MKFLFFIIASLLNTGIWLFVSEGLKSGRGFFSISVLLLFSMLSGLYFFRKKLLFQENIFLIIIYFNVILFFLFVLINLESVYHRILVTMMFFLLSVYSVYSKKQDTKDYVVMKSLLDRKIQELGELHNISNAINSVLDLELLLDMVLSVTVDVLKVGRVSLFLFDEKKENLVLKISKGLDRELVNNLTIPIGQGIIGKVAVEGNPLLIKDIERELDGEKKSQKNDKYSNKSFLCVPLKIKNEIIGVLSVNNKENNEIFNENDLELLIILSSQIAVAIENANLYDNMKDSYKTTILALSNALDAKDSYTGGHSSQVTKYAIPIAEYLGYNKKQLERLEYASLLHDIGKIGIIENILNKNGRLTDDEFSIIKKHPVIGADILQSVNFLEDIVPIVKYHHERWDGHGYPEGLKGEEIPLGARIIAVADTFDAMTSDRPYREGLPAKIAKAEIEKCSGTQFDPVVAKAFLKLFDEGKIIVEKYDFKNRWL